MRYFGLAFICFFVIGTLVHLFFPVHTSQSVVQHHFIINKSFAEVRKPLVRKDVLEEMISMSQGRVISKQWDQLDLSIEKIITGEFTVNGRGRFVVEMKDQYMGKIQLEFSQFVFIDKHRMKINTRLIRPNGIIQAIESNTYIDEGLLNNKETRVWTESKIIARSRLPVSYKQYMDNKVEEANLNSIKNMEICIKQITSEPKSRFNIPLK